MKFFCLDERDVWHAAALTAARNHGFEGKRILRGGEVDGAGLGFIRPHADPVVLVANQQDYDLMASQLTMIQDLDQVRLYENKSGQFAKWEKWMPPTWRFTDSESALAFVKAADYPIVSKADVGASSLNVRILKNELEGVSHVQQLFGAGICIDHCSAGAGKSVRSVQKGYALFQFFMPHTVTWRVNAIGGARAVFKRYCYKDRPVAQTGNVEPVMQMTPQVESLLEFCNGFFAEAGTKWCAIDVLEGHGLWRMLETSLAWPWPSPGKCNQAPIFGTKRTWIDLFEVMFDEYEAGAWA
jgi:hypothetical protein